MNPRKIDWLLAFFAVLVLWSAGYTMLCFASQTLGANSIVYVCTSLFSGSVCILIYTGLGSKEIAKRILFCANTWVYGIALIISYIISFILFSKVTPVEGTLLQMFAVILSLIMSWAIFKRKPNKFQLVGATLIMLGLVIIFKGFEASAGLTIAIVLFLLTLFQVGRSFAAECHKEFRRAMERSSVPLKDQLRVIGYVVFILSCMFLMVTMPFVQYQNYYDIVLHPAIPSLADFMNTKAIALGAILGFCLTLPERFIEFNSLARLKTENYLAIGSLSPFATMAWQKATQSFTGLDLTGFTGSDFVAAVIITIGGLIMIMTKDRLKALTKRLVFTRPKAVKNLVVD